MVQCKRGDFSTCVAPRPGRHKTVTTPEIIDQIHELILEDRRISSKSIFEKLGISRERVGSIIHEDLDIGKLSAKWIPKCMNEDQTKTSTVSVVWTNLELFHKVCHPRCVYNKLGCVYLSDTTIRWKMYVYLLHKINYMFRPLSLAIFRLIIENLNHLLSSYTRPMWFYIQWGCKAWGGNEISHAV